MMIIACFEWVLHVLVQMCHNVAAPCHSWHLFDVHGRRVRTERAPAQNCVALLLLLLLLLLLQV
jgi:hypothetical protein